MELKPIPIDSRQQPQQPLPPGDVLSSHAPEVAHVLRNTYALLSLTLLFSAAVATAGMVFKLPAPGLLLTLAGCFGLLFAVYRFKDGAIADADAHWSDAERHVIDTARRCWAQETRT
jgi:modulator of FtsH protease